MLLSVGRWRRSAIAGGRVPWLVLLLAVWAAGCWPAPGRTVQPRDGRAGLQLSGSVADRQLAVSDGAPQLVVGDCDPDAAGDADLCAIAEDIDGQLVVLVFENPDVLRAPATLPVVDPGCDEHCDDVTGGVVVDLQLGTGARMRARSGRVVLAVVQPFARYAGEVRLTLPSGSVAGTFDLVPHED